MAFMLAINRTNPYTREHPPYPHPLPPLHRMIEQEDTNQDSQQLPHNGNSNRSQRSELLNGSKDERLPYGVGEAKT